MSLTKAQQRLNREELKLARLKKREARAQLNDTRLKYRLGSMLYWVGWQGCDTHTVNARIAALHANLDTPESISEMRSIGAAELLRRNTFKIITTELSTTSLSDAQKIALDQQILHLGNLMIENGMDQYPKTAVLGALLLATESLSPAKESGQ